MTVNGAYHAFAHDEFRNTRVPSALSQAVRDAGHEDVRYGDSWLKRCVHLE